MKTLVMSMILTMTAIVNALCATPEKTFAYNNVVEEGRLSSQTVYVVKDGKFLHARLQYRFHYDASGSLVRKEVMKWSGIDSSFKRYYCMDYAYRDGEVEMICSMWNERAGDYTDVRAKSVYLSGEGNMGYQSYEWDARANGWNLTVEHYDNAADGLQLLAGNKN